MGRSVALSRLFQCNYGVPSKGDWGKASVAGKLTSEARVRSDGRRGHGPRNTSNLYELERDNKSGEIIPANTIPLTQLV